MTKGAQKMRDFYALKPGAPIYQKEFGFYVLDRWKDEGHIAPDATWTELSALFGYDESGKHHIGGLGWCEAAFCPTFDETVLEDRGDYELVRDFAGRHVLCFKERRSGFMPEYVDHPVKDWRTWEELCKWRLNPETPERYADIGKVIDGALEAEAEGQIICQGVVGGYMYLRSLIGPLELMYMLYDEPELIHDIMQTWLKVSDAVIAKYQQRITLDELFLAEDICYNHGLLISEDMVKEFLFPYYQQLIENIKRRQLDKNRKLHLQIDTDGNPLNGALDMYLSIGMDYMSPFEVASGCDVVAVGKQYPELLISGGIDKRILATTTDAIDREIDRIMPVMQARGGFIPTCDHGVPEEVSFENYMHYRKRMLEFA